MNVSRYLALACVAVIAKCWITASSTLLYENVTCSDFHRAIRPQCISRSVTCGKSKCPYQDLTARKNFIRLASDYARFFQVMLLKYFFSYFYNKCDINLSSRLAQQTLPTCRTYGLGIRARHVKGKLHAKLIKLARHVWLKSFTSYFRICENLTLYMKFSDRVETRLKKMQLSPWLTRTFMLTRFKALSPVVTVGQRALSAASYGAPRGRVSWGSLSWSTAAGQSPASDCGLQR